MNWIVDKREPVDIKLPEILNNEINLPSMAVLDTGASASIADMEALQRLIDFIFAKFGDVEHYTDREGALEFRFGNGQTKWSYGVLWLKLPIGWFGVHVMDAPGTPVLISLESMIMMRTVIDLDDFKLELRALSTVVPLLRSQKGHLTFDLCLDTPKKLEAFEVLE